MRQLLCLLPLLALLGGCESTAQRQLAEGYPPAFVDGFSAGCASGRAAAGALDQYRKDVPRYLADTLYAQGWDDGQAHCLDFEQARQADRDRELTDHDRERRWRQQLEQDKAKALGGRR